MEPNVLILNGTDQELTVGFDVDIQGTAGQETVLIEDGAMVGFTAQSGDRVDVAGTLSDYTIERTGLTELTLTDSEGGETITLTVNSGQSFDLRFADGNVTVGLEGGNITVGDEELGLNETADVNNIDLGNDVSDVPKEEPEPTVGVQVSPDPVDEGASATITVNTTNIADGETVFYELSGSGIDGDDFGIPLTGAIEINGNTGTLSVPILADETTEGSETFATNITFPKPTVIEDPIVGFDAARVGGDASGFFLENASDLFAPGAPASVGSIIADLSAPDTIDFDEPAGLITLDGLDLLLSPEIAQALGDASLAGTDIGDARVDAEVIPNGSNFEVTGGTTSVSIDSILLDTLGVELAVNDTPDTPAAGFDFGFAINGDDDTPFVLEPAGVPVSGDINHTGEVVLTSTSGIVEASTNTVISDTSIDQVNTIPLINGNGADDDVTGVDGEEDIFEISLADFAASEQGNFNLGSDVINNFNPSEDIIRFIDAPENLDEFDELGTVASVFTSNGTADAVLQFSPVEPGGAADIALPGLGIDAGLTAPTLASLTQDVGVNFDFVA